MALAEREQEFVAISAVLDRGGILLIEAGAGLGKTTLLAEATSRARAGGREVLTASGSELEADFAFGIVRQLLERRVAKTSPRARDGLLAGPAAIAGRLLLGGTAASDATDTSFALLHGLYWLVANLAELGPLVLVVDDLHVADGPSLRWLAHLGARVDGLDVALVLAARPFEPTRDDASMGRLRAGATVIRPRLLSSTAVAGIVRDALGEQERADTVAELDRASGGNPFYLAELLRGAADPCGPAEDANDLLARSGEEITRHVLARLRRLDARAQALAHALAVLGAAWPLRVGAAVAGMPLAEGERAADDLVRFEVLADVDPPLFLHPIIRDVLEGSLRSHERIATHRSAARVLTRHGAPAGQVAAHLARCPPAEDRWVVDRLREAASAALDAGAPQTSIDLLRRAWAEPPPSRMRLDVLRELARAEAAVGLASACERLEEALELTDDPQVRGALVLELVDTYTGLFRWAEAVDVVETVLASPGALEANGAGRLEAAVVVAALHDARCAKRVGPLLGHVGPPGGATDQVRAIATGMAMVLGGHRADDAAVVLEGALSSGSGAVSWDSRAALLWALVTTERFEVVEAELARLRIEAERSGSARGLVAVFTTLALLQLRLGALPEAEGSARIAVRVLQEGDFTPGLAFGATVLADVLVETGELDEAKAVLSLLPSEPLSPGVGTVLIPAARGRLALAEGRQAEALVQFETCASMFSSEVWGMDVRDVGYVHARSGAALALLQLGRREEAVALAEAELADVRAFDAPRALGVSLRAAGLTVGGEAGREQLAASVDSLRRSSAVLERARSLVELGAALRRAGRRTAARGHLAEALDLAARCAARPLAARAREELVAAGARPRRDRRFGVEALTPSERRVARLAAEARSNREIAQRLYVTIKTVEGHLAQVYVKLGITGRGQLAEALDPGKVQGVHPVVGEPAPG